MAHVLKTQPIGGHRLRLGLIPQAGRVSILPMFFGHSSRDSAPLLLTPQRLPVSRVDELVKELDKMIKGENESEKLDEVRRARAPWCT